MKKIFYLIVAAVVFFSCKENEIPLYSGPAALNIYGGAGNNPIKIIQVPMAFSNSADSTLMIEVSVNGYPSDKARIAKFIVVADSSTVTAVGKNFIMDMNVTIPANKLKTTIPIKIVKEGLAEYGTDGIKMYITPVASDDFSVGTVNLLTILASDDFPKDWVNTFWAANYIGKCTKAKYKMVYEMTGVYDFKPYNYNWFIPLQQALNAKLFDMIQATGNGLWDPEANDGAGGYLTQFPDTYSN